MKKSNKKKSAEGGSRHKSGKEEIQFENELKKLKLSAQYGAQFSEGESKLPPEIENQWLENIEKFEEQYHNCKQVTVYECLGKPEMLLVDEIPEENMEAELGTLYFLLDEKGIVVDSICEVEPKEMYRFITEELFQHQMDDINVEGMTTHYIYEEFHPNDELDIKDRVDGFFRSLSNDFFEHLKYALADKLTDWRTKKPITREKAMQSLKHFVNSFSRVELKSLKFTDVIIKGRKASANFELDYISVIESSEEEVHYKGESTFSLVKDKLDYWVISKVNFPGFNGS